jgi:hypothetical protein
MILSRPPEDPRGHGAAGCALMFSDGRRDRSASNRCGLASDNGRSRAPHSGGASQVMASIRAIMPIAPMVPSLGHALMGIA